MENKDLVIRARGLTKIFHEGRKAVDSFDFFVKRGKCVSLLGPNGAGKTTTINMLLGLVVPTSGRIEIFGRNISGALKEIKHSIGVAPQTDNLDPDLTVLENLMIYASYYSIPAKTAKKRAEELLDFFALSKRRDEIIQNLSGGQRRSLIIARALINDPELIILDEPTIGLDPRARHLIWERLETLKSRGTTMLLTSHYMEEVQRLADRVVIMEGGRKILEGEPGSLILEHIGEYVMEIPEGRQGLEHLSSRLKHCGANFELHGKKLFIYYKKRCPELEDLTKDYSHVVKRPANLEDLFLRYTGRRLMEGAGNHRI